MTNDNEKPSEPAEDEQPAGETPEPAPSVQPAEPVATVEQAPQPLAAAEAPAPAAARPGWRPSSAILKVGAAGAAALLLFGSGVALGTVIEDDDRHGPRLSREGMRGMPDMERQMPRDRMMPPREGAPSLQEMPGSHPQR